MTRAGIPIARARRRVSRRRWRAWLTGAAVVAAVLGTTTAPAAGKQPPPSPGSAAPRPADTTHEVTLVTGDRVRVTTGNRPTAAVLETAPGTTAYSVFQAGSALYVIPDQAMPLIAA